MVPFRNRSKQKVFKYGTLKPSIGEPSKLNLYEGPYNTLGERERKPRRCDRGTKPRLIVETMYPEGFLQAVFRGSGLGV